MTLQRVLSRETQMEYEIRNTKYEIWKNDLSKVKITCQNKCDKNLWKDALAYAIIVIKCEAKSPQQHHPFGVWNNSTLE